MNRFQLATAVVAATAALGGCVSSGKYEQLEADKAKLEANKNQEITDLQNEKTSVQAQLSALATEKSTLQEQIAALEKEKAALESTSHERQSQYDALVKKLSAEVEQGQLQVRQYKNMLSVDVAEKIFFDSGRAVLKESGKEVLSKVGEALKSYQDKVIRVVGYTDNVPIAKSMQKIFPSNWELSVARATNVVRFLQDAGVPPERMVAAGRGEYSPVAEKRHPRGPAEESAHRDHADRPQSRRRADHGAAVSSPARTGRSRAPGPVWTRGVRRPLIRQHLLRGLDRAGP